MPRRLLALLAVIGVFAIVACQGAPAVPALSDPKDILARTVLSLKDIKTITVHGELTGTATIPGSGTIDLKNTTLDAAYDIAGKKGRFAVSAPSLLGTTAEVLYVDNAAYYKITGPLAKSLGADPTGKYKKTTVAPAGTDPNAIASDPAAAIDKFKAALDKLPNPPTKAANEKCGDKDCYHIVLTLSDKDLAALSSTASPAASPATQSNSQCVVRAVHPDDRRLVADGQPAAGQARRGPRRRHHRQGHPDPHHDLRPGGRRFGAAGGPDRPLTLA